LAAPAVLRVADPAAVPHAGRRVRSGRAVRCRHRLRRGRFGGLDRRTGAVGPRGVQPVHPRQGGSGMTGAFAAFGRHDLKTIRRDSIFVILVIGPFLYAAIIWLVPMLTEWVRQQWSFDLTPYHSLIITAFPILGPPLLQGAMLGLQILDDKDQHTLTALRVTPVPPLAYPAYRAGLTIVVTAVMVPLALAITGMATPMLVLKAIPIGIVGGLLGVVCGLTMASMANNKIEGL